MSRLTGFIAYPSRPDSIGQVIEETLNVLKPFESIVHLASWKENDIAGRFLIDPILTNINGSDVLVADITALNFNVVFEIGYAIARKKRVFLTRNSSLEGSDGLIREVGIFDTLGYTEYHSSKGLAKLIRDIVKIDPIVFDTDEINTGSPVYVVLPRQKTDLEVRFISRIKKARLSFRSFDAEELGRLSAGEAIENVAQSYGVALSLLPKMRRDSEVHNFRAAFVAGLAMGLNKTLLLLQAGEDPVPLDYRDLVKSFQQLNQIDGYVGAFATEVGGLLQRVEVGRKPGTATFLERLNLGASAAENEMHELDNYYLETDEFYRTLRGEVRVVSGRKGSGKTALFVQARNRLREDKSKVVVDLKPEGFQLIKFREQVIDYLEDGTKEHTITVFWEYLLLLEICNKLLEKDRSLHMRDNVLFGPYRKLADAYESDEYVSEGDFSERMLKLMQRISDDFAASKMALDGLRFLKTGEITELLYRHDLATLRSEVTEYLTHKKGVWILFDNLDKGWPANGVRAEDVLGLRCLIDAMNTLENDFRRKGILCHGSIFIRNDVYELLIAGTSDRGKTPSAILDWTDPDLLRELLRRRFLYTDKGLGDDVVFDDIWRRICATHIEGEETSQYLIDRSLMRPRAIIDLVRCCRSHAVNLGHEIIEATDIENGEAVFSNGVLTDIDYELQDVLGTDTELLYEFIEANELLSMDEIRGFLSKAVSDDRIDDLFNLLLWYGFFGLIRDDGEPAYIYSVKYDMRHLKALINKQSDQAIFRINPAFWKALETKH